MHQTIQVHQLEDVKTCTKWQKRTKHLLITAGNYKNIQNNHMRKEKNTWLGNSPWKRHVTSVSWHTLMLEKQQQPSVFFSIQDVFIKLEKHTKVLLKWTG